MLCDRRRTAAPPLIDTKAEFCSRVAAAVESAWARTHRSFTATMARACAGHLFDLFTILCILYCLRARIVRERVL